MSDTTKDSCPRCGCVEKEWMQRSPDGESKCNSCGFVGKHDKWVPMVISAGTQNPTEPKPHANMDEAERFAVERIDSWNRQFYGKYMAPGQAFQYLRADIISLLAESYRAGQASRDLEFERQRDTKSALKEGLYKQHEELTALREENARLKSELESADCLLLTTQAKSLALVDALDKIENYETLGRGNKYNSYEQGWFGVASFAREALAAYRKDGEKL